jgi:ribosome biogenesis GTPase
MSDRSIEEEYGFESLKESRLERKIASKTDRSKFKKTDWDKRGEELPDHLERRRDEFLEGKVTSIHSLGADVATESKVYECVISGRLKLENRRIKNIIAVGDQVLFKPEGEDQGSILHVLPRKTILARAETLSHKSQQIIATNVDQVLITLSVVDPLLKPFLADRYIIAARKGGMDPIIVINKIDLLEGHPEEQELLAEMLEAYAVLGIPILQLSADAQIGLDALRDIMRNKTSVFSGQSGVGKSSLINAITGLDLLTGRTVGRTKKGAHTTSKANLLPLAFGGWCVDTPGIKSFGVWDLGQDEIQGFYSEIAELGAGCKFMNCSHTHEPQCAVIAALKEGKLSPLRYRSYLQLLESVEADHKRR